MKKLSKDEQKESIKELKKYIKKGDTVYCSLANVNRSGDYRNIQILIANKKRILNISYRVAELLGWTYKDRTNAVGVYGGGMDMGFHIVYNLSRTLFRGDRSGYAVKHQWI